MGEEGLGRKWKSLSCIRLCDPMDYTVNRILQARLLEWVAIPFSRGSSQLMDRTQVSHIAGGFCTSWATKEALHLGISSVFAALIVKGHLNALYTTTTPNIINPNFFLWLDILRQDTDNYFQKKNSS